MLQYAALCVNRAHEIVKELDKYDHTNAWMDHFDNAYRISARDARIAVISFYTMFTGKKAFIQDMSRWFAGFRLYPRW